jgi:syntaxin 16
LLSSVDSDAGGDAVIEMDLLPPRWADVSDEVSDLLSGIARKSALLERLHNKHVLPGFDDSASEEGKIERLTGEITADFHACQDRIHAVGTMLKGCSKSEEVMGRNIQMSLAQRVQDSSTLFRKKQSAYLKSISSLLYPSSGADLLPQELRGIPGTLTPLSRSDSPSSYSDPNADPSADVSFSQSALQQSATLTSNDAAIMQREREITDIAKGIIELADIFKELQTMVIDQGTMLDRIDFNVERLNVHVKEADREMTVVRIVSRSLGVGRRCGLTRVIRHPATNEKP